MIRSLFERLLRAGAQRMFNDESRLQGRYSTMPFGRAAAPEETANAGVFLASSRSSYTNGTILAIDVPAGLLSNKRQAPA